MWKIGQFLAKKCPFLGVAEGPLKKIKLQNLHETLTKGPMYDILKIYEDAPRQIFLIWPNVAFWNMLWKNVKIPHSINTEKRVFPIKKIAHHFGKYLGAKIQVYTSRKLKK